MFPRETCTEIGQAVLASQLFEEWLVNSFHTLKIVTGDGYRLSQEQLTDHRLYKEPLKNLIKKLDSSGHIDPNLFDRVQQLLDRRNLLVHRWFITRGSPSRQSPEDWQALTDLAICVRTEALSLTFLLLGRLAGFWQQVKDGRDLHAVRDEIESLFGLPGGA